MNKYLQFFLDSLFAYVFALVMLIPFLNAIIFRIIKVNAIIASVVPYEIAKMYLKAKVTTETADIDELKRRLNL